MNNRYNLEYLNEISGGDVSFVHQMIKEFIEITPSTLEHLQNSFQTSDWFQLKDRIHQFAPQLEYLGLHNTRKLVESIEECIKINPLPEKIEMLLNEIISDCQGVIGQLKIDFPQNVKS